MFKEILIPFNRPYTTGVEFDYILKAKSHNKLAGDGEFTQFVHKWLEDYTKCKKALLTHSCTAALEMAAILLDVKPGDEIILPSYTFVSTANAFVLRGAKPIFIDIREDTLCIDENLIEQAITSRTKAIVPVHYAGVSCEMDRVMEIAKKYNLKVVEDAAQGIMSTYKGQSLGAIGDLGTLSFHETKNIISGEGGALLINDKSMISRAEIIREKGTNRSNFFRGEVDKYTWTDIGSSYLPGEIVAAFLLAQLEKTDQIHFERKKIWDFYHSLLEEYEKLNFLKRPKIPQNIIHNSHIYYIILDPKISRDQVLKELKLRGIHALFHYVPLHDSAAGKFYGRVSSPMNITNKISESIIRLPIWIGLTFQQQEYVVKSLGEILSNLNN
jgi:dTDP-4-amino-4,6-dideoxygalactose transaminase